jgi:VWFA-related protein
LASTIAVLALIGTAAAKEPVFRSDVTLVRVNAEVADGGQRIIAGLKAEDFLLAENGQLQPIRHFGNQDMPLDVVFLFDVSSSMRPQLERLSAAAHDALSVLGEQDRVAMMVFDNQARQRLSLRTNRSEVVSEFEKLLREEKFERGTEIPRAIIDAAKLMAREARPDARRAIVIVTDDRTNSRPDDKGAERALAKADSVLSALIVPVAEEMGGAPPPHRSHWPGIGPGGVTWGGGGGGGGGMGGHPPGGGPTRRLLGNSANTSEIAIRSGGDSLSVEDKEPLKTTLTRIRQRYTLHFYLPEDAKPGEERTLDVLLSPAARVRYPDAKLRFHDFYIVPKKD